MMIEFISWDWKGPYDPKLLTDAIARFRGGPIYATAVDDGTDSRIVALSDQPISPAEATRSWISS